MELSLVQFGHAILVHIFCDIKWTFPYTWCDTLCHCPLLGCWLYCWRLGAWLQRPGFDSRSGKPAHNKLLGMFWFVRQWILLTRQWSKLHYLVSKIHCLANQNKPDIGQRHRVSHSLLSTTPVRLHISYQQRLLFSMLEIGIWLNG